jgi:hypothetical protein
MVTPGRDREVYDLGVWIMACEKSSANSEGARSRDGLGHCDLISADD